VIARMNLILDKNEAKGRSLKPVDTGIEAEKALREALVTGKVGALSVDPQYLIVRAPRGNSPNDIWRSSRRTDISFPFYPFRYDEAE